MSQILCISRHSPYQTALANEALDTVLAAGAFDQAIALLLMDEGVWQATGQQRPESIQSKSIARKLSALPLYGVETLYIHEPSLAKRGLTRDSLCHNAVQLLDDERTRSLIAKADHILSF